jgi:hypothetical protein
MFLIINPLIIKFLQFVMDKVNLSVTGVAYTQTKDSNKNILIPFGYVCSLLVCTFFRKLCECHTVQFISNSVCD